MLRTSLVLLLLAVPAAPSAAQPAHGHLILSFLQKDSQNQIAGGFTAAFPPANPAAWTTIATAPAYHWHNWVRMAPDNADLVIAQCNGRIWQSNLVQVGRTGPQTTVSPSLPVQLDGFELDHDDCWIACGKNVTFNCLYGIQHTAGTARTFVALSGLPSGSSFNEMTIDRDPSGPTYAIAVYDPGTSTSSSSKILHADRRYGVVGSCRWSGNPLQELSGIELHPRTGDYVTTDFMGPTRGEPSGVEFNRVTKTGGMVTPLYPHFGANAVKIDQQDTAWVIGWLGSIQAVLRYDLTNNAFVSFVQLTGLPPNSVAMSVEIYGSRTLVCNQPAATPSTVRVNVQSRMPTAGGQSYALAVSFDRRPGLRMPNGEWLHLNTTGPLFLMSALNVLPPATFQDFRGILNPFGNATATVNIPKSLCGVGIPIFVGGVIYDQTGITQVTDTHWFVL